MVDNAIGIWSNQRKTKRMNPNMRSDDMQYTNITATV